MKRLIPALLIISGLTACTDLLALRSNSGINFCDEKLVKVGETKRSEVEVVLGQPYTLTANLNGTYAQYRNGRNLVGVTYNTDGIAVEYNCTVIR